MVSNEDNWIRFFEIPDVSKHKKGFTIYKVVSMLYPQKCPDAITKITVWKRYNDFKKLHREMKSLHHTLRIRDKFPSLPSTKFFNRFDEEVIQQRKQMIQNFLDYISVHSQLFTSNSFVKFFETSHTPTAMLNSTINSIRADLNLPVEPEYLSFHSPDSDEDCTMSDTDSISTMSSLSSSFVQITDNISDQMTRSTTTLTGLSNKINSNLSLNTSNTSKSSSETDSQLNLFDVPDCGFLDINNSNYSHLNYIEDADKYILTATQYEVDKKYSEALDAYRNGIYLLLKYIKDEKNSNKRQMIQFKVDKCLMVANKIFSLYLSNDKKEHQEFMTDPYTNSFITHFSKNLSTGNLYKTHKTLSSEYQILDNPKAAKNNSAKQIKYIAEAENHILFAAQMESEKKYAEAFNTYKEGIYILLKHVKDDKDHDRKQVVRFKVEKYILRAEKIYNLYLANEDLSKDVLEVTVQRPLSDLYKYKVIKVFDDGMTVLHKESQELFYIKVIYKECIFTDDDLILPKQVPFMVQMHNYYNCENALFLILQYCSGLKLWDYVNSISSEETIIDTDHTKVSNISDNDSECSYSELLLITEYNLNQNMTNSMTSTKQTNGGTDTEPVDTDDIILKSQELLSSVNETLKKHNESKKSLTDECKTDDEFEFINVPSQRKLSETSDYDMSDLEEFTRVSQENVIKWSAQLLLALEKLHKSGVICCDLQSKNILINEKGDLVLTYMCRVYRRKIFNYNNIAILAPEVYRFENITTAADWWSYGTILYEMLVGMPISYIHPEGISSYTMLKVPKFVSVQARSLLKQLLTYDAHSRLGTGINGTEEIKSHPFFNSVYWESLLLQ